MIKGRLNTSTALSNRIFRRPLTLHQTTLSLPQNPRVSPASPPSPAPQPPIPRRQYRYFSAPANRNICYHPTTREEVKPHLRHPKPYRKHGTAANEKRGRIPNRRSIHEREAQADNCTHIGHHEGDTVIGRNHKGALLTLVERKSLFTHIAAMPNRKSSSTISHCIQQLRSAGARSVTFDNGKEFAEHERLNEFGIDTYFADPYHSWQRGKNENTNGLIRQYLPKWAKLDKVTQAEAEWIAQRLNNRPRKSLGWQTPSEVFAGVNNLAFGC